MKICFVGSAKSIHMQRWVKWFAERGHEIHLISPNYEDIEGVKIHLIGKKKEGSVTNFIRKMFQTRKLVWRIKPDILHAHYAFGHGTFAAFANYHPFVVSVYGSDVLRDAKESKLKRIAITYVLKKADAVLHTAQFMEDYLHHKFKIPRDKIVRVPWGIDLNIFHKGYKEEVEKLREELGIGKDTVVVLSNRHIHPKYNIEKIVKAIPTVIREHPKTVFIFIRGDGDVHFENQIMELANALRVSDSIRLIKRFISPQEMAIYLNLSDIVISVPKTDQFSSSIMEAMACGAVPIVSDIEAYKQYLTDGKNALFVNPDNPIEISRKILYYIKHPDIKDMFYKINRPIIEKNENWEKNAFMMETLYRKLLDNAGKQT